MTERALQGLRKGAAIGLVVGLTLAIVFLLAGSQGNEASVFLAYSCAILGFPVSLLLGPILNALGLHGGMPQYVAIVLLTLPLNGLVLGSVIGALVHPGRDGPGASGAA
jgi:hypothetical protein